MVRAVANRPVEQFATDAASPDWEAEGDNEIWFTPPDDQPVVDADGNPIEPGSPPYDDGKSRGPNEATPPNEDEAAPERLNQEWLDRTIGRRDPREERRAPRREERPARRGDNEAI